MKKVLIICFTLFQYLCTAQFTGGTQRIEVNTITDAQTITSTTPVDIAGSSFTLPSTGVWIVIVKINGMHNPSSSSASFGVYNSSDVLQANSVSNLYTSNAGGTLGLFSSEQFFLITTSGSETFKIKGVVSAGSTLSIKNSSNQSNIGNGGNSKIIAFK